MTAHPGVTEHLIMATRWIPVRGKAQSALTWPLGGLVDEMLDRYVDWREDAGLVAEAYARWSGAPAAEEHWRFSVYMAALDQEESSARSYAMGLAAVERSLHFIRGSAAAA
jgi:hypothetical protein